MASFLLRKRKILVQFCGRTQWVVENKTVRKKQFCTEIQKSGRRTNQQRGGIRKDVKTTEISAHFYKSNEELKGKENKYIDYPLDIL